MGYTDDESIDETYDSSRMVCPYCKKVADDYPFEAFENDGELAFQCPHCEKWFIGEQSTSITFTGTPIVEFSQEPQP